MSLLLGLCLFVAEALAGPGSVAVMYFQNQGNPELEPLKVGLTQMLTTDLVGAGGVTVVERTQLQALMDELKLGHSAVVDKDTSSKLGKLLGAEYLILGSYFSLAGTLRVDARLVRVETGEVVYASGSNGTVAEFLDIERKVAAGFRERIGQLIPGAVPPLPALAALTSAVGTGQPLDAALKFSDGLIALDQHELPRARESFQAAIAADPRMDAARAQLASMEL
ncbi:MAG: CsgG/HfaB family protein [Pseudomonadota bacterium]|nr:CsgG/HfaB family protein [Pseudomonadota bacterium]